MNEEIINYLSTQRVGVLAVEMPDGSPHAATVHFAYDTDSGIFLFETYRSYRKAEPLFKKEITRASFVVGSDESNMKTLQMDGDAQIIKNDAEKELFEKVYFGTFSEKREKAKKLGAEFVSFTFKPSWWRFTDWTQPLGKIILTSGQTKS